MHSKCLHTLRLKRSTYLSSCTCNIYAVLQTERLHSLVFLLRPISFFSTLRLLCPKNVCRTPLPQSCLSHKHSATQHSKLMWFRVHIFLVKFIVSISVWVDVFRGRKVGITTRTFVMLGADIGKIPYILTYF